MPALERTSLIVIHCDSLWNVELRGDNQDFCEIVSNHFLNPCHKQYTSLQAAKILSRHLYKFFSIRMLRSENCSDLQASLCRYLVSVALGDLADQAVCSE